MTYTRERSLPALAQTNAAFTRWRRRQRLSLTLNGVTSSVAELNCGSVASLALLAAEVENFSSANGGVSQLDRLMQIPNPVHATPEKYVIGCCNYDDASAPRFRHALRQALTPTSQSACTHTHTHVTHRMVRASDHLDRCTRGKNDIMLVSHTNRSFRVLGIMCSYDGELFNFDFLCMFFFPLIETVTYTCHYMTDRLERFDLKTSKLDLLKKKRHLHLGCPWGKLIDTTF